MASGRKEVRLNEFILEDQKDGLIKVKKRESPGFLGGMEIDDWNKKEGWMNRGRL